MQIILNKMNDVNKKNNYRTITFAIKINYNIKLFIF